MKPIDYRSTIRADGSPMFSYHGMIANIDMDLLLGNQDGTDARVRLLEGIYYDIRSEKIDLYGPEFTSGESVFTDDIRRYNGFSYKAKTDHTTSDTPDIDTTNWELAVISEYDLTVVVGG